MATQLISVSVGRPREVPWKEKRVLTGIFKEPVAARTRLRTLNLDGDQQADLSVHGGADKAVYAYPSEHYLYWQAELAEPSLPWGMFGENFTTAGLSEDTVNIGDRFRVGSAEVMVTQPRLPCYKLGIKFGREDMVKRFLASGRTGFYFAVVQEGDVGPGDRLERTRRQEHGVTVMDITRLYAAERDDLRMLRRAVAVEALPESWRAHFRRRIDKQVQ